MSRQLYPIEYVQWMKNPTNNDATNAVLKRIQPILNSAITSYAGKDSRMNIKARLSALELMKKYDPNAGIQLNTYLMSNLKKLTRVKRERDAVIHMPENIYYNQQAIKRSAASIWEGTGKEATDTQISDDTGLSVKQIKKANKTRAAMNNSSYMTEKGDHLQSIDRDYSEVWKDYVYFDLDDTNKKIFEWTTGYNDSKILPKNVIAKKLKISSAAVSQRITKMQGDLRAGDNINVG